MEKYTVNTVEEITPKLVVALLERYELNEVPRLKKLEQYYNNETEIKKRMMGDSDKPNHKISHSYASLITDTIVGYFMGKPINITYTGKDKVSFDKFDEILKSNNDQSHNSRMVKTLSILGVAYELVYMDEESEIKYTWLDPINTFIIFDNTVQQKALGAVRFYNITNYLTEEEEKKIVLHTKDTITEWTLSEAGELEEVYSEPNKFDSMNIVYYRNNDYTHGDFEKVMDLIDALNLAVSDTANELSYLSDAYILLSGMEDTDKEDIQDMKNNRVMVAPEGADAKWVVKGNTGGEVETYKERLKEDIHALSYVPNMSMSRTGQTQSGEALKFQLFNLENMVAIKERFFKEGLQKRYKLINQILHLKSFELDVDDIIISFNRNIPTNNMQIIDMASKLTNLVSHETILAQLPFVEDIEGEMKRFNKQQQQESILADAYNELNLGDEAHEEESE